MRKILRVVIGAACAAGCGGDGATAPIPGGTGPALARQFEQLADSVGNAGDSATSSALRHAAEIVRLTGHATPVTVVIDRAPRSFLAVAEQLDFPNIVCSWPGDSGVAPPGDTTGSVPPTFPDSGNVTPGAGSQTPEPACTVMDTTSMRTLIAWEPTHMAEVVRLVADMGSSGVDSTVPDVMVSLPTRPMPADSQGGGVSGGGAGGSGFGGTPGFRGEYLVGSAGSWYAVEGTQSNALEELTGACTAHRATIDWAEFDCSAARIRFAFEMRMEPAAYLGPPLGAPGMPVPETADSGGSHTVAMAATAVDGVRLSVVAWVPPPAPPPVPVPGPGPDPMPMPGDTMLTSSGRAAP